jgi:Fe-Mn family superoxide dismutase
MFWEIMKPGGGGQPAGRLLDAIAIAFGSVDAFKDQVSKAALSRFGNGWAWLVQSPDGMPAVESTANQDSPLIDGKWPVFGTDVWEHAYYLKYQNRRADYGGAWWNVLNWGEVAKRLK